jgi:hypothetical protein
MKKVFLAGISLFAMVMLYGETTWLRVTRDGKSKDTSVTRTVSEQNGLRTISEKAEQGTSVCVLNVGGEAVRYEFTDKNGSCVMERNASTVKITGTYKGKKVYADIKLGKAGWYGSFEYGLSALCASGKKDLVAMLINPADPSKSIEMKYTLVGDEKLGDMPVHKIKISLTGMLANFWSAYYWVNDKGETMRYEGDEGPGTGKMVVEYLRTE